MLPRLRLALVLLLLLPLLAPGCARVPLGALEPLEPGQLEARVALGQAEGDPVEHALAMAEAELALGRPDRAGEAARTALRRAEAAWWSARLRGDAEATRLARRRLDRTAAAARRWAERTDDDALMVLAVLADAHPRRHRAALRRAVAVLPQPPRDLDPLELVELVGNDAPAQRQLTRWLGDEDRERAGRTGTHDGDPEALDLLGQALERATWQRRGAAEVRERAMAVLATDPWALDARLVVLGLDEVAAGVLADDPLLLEDLLTSLEGGNGRLARLHLRTQASAGSRAAPLALAWWMLREDLVGDAHGVLEGLSGALSEREDAALGLLAQLRAMAAARRGDVAALERWRIGHEVRSPSLDAWLAMLDEQGHSAALRAAAARARRRLARVAVPVTDLELEWAMLLDPHLEPAVRHRVRHGLYGSRGEVEAWRAICGQTHRDAAACASLWLHEAPAMGLALAGRTRHFHPDLLDDASELDASELRGLGSLVAAYEGTVLAASPELEATRLRLALATGDHAGARARLRTHGALLPASERTWAWLVLEDLEAGTTAYDDARRWLPVFDPEVGTEATGEPEPPAPLRIDRYAQGMAAAADGRHAEALERLVPVLAAGPDAALVDGLAQAALAAHLAGDAPLRDALSERLRAVDPHGPAYALVQARVHADAGRRGRAREAVEHALAWHPDEVALHRRMVALLGEGTVPSDALALAFIREMAPPDEYLYQPLRQQIRRGMLGTLAVVEEMRAAIDGTPADAWALRTELLVKLPWLVERAVSHGVQQVREAGTLEEARPRAEAVLARLDAAGSTITWSRQQQVWLDLLLGRTEAGLAAARRLDRAHGLVPMSEGDSAVLLLQARAAGEIDDALAWDVWRWVHGTDAAAAARVQALLEGPPRGSILQAFACGELSTGEDLGPALAVCDAAWRDQPKSLAVAVSQSFLALNRPEPIPTGEAVEGTSTTSGSAMAAAVLGSGPAAPTFAEVPTLALGENLADPWHHNHAVWLGERGEHEAAAEAWWQAYAFGLAGDAGLRHGYEQVRFRGALVRSLQGLRGDMDARSLDLRRAMLALAGADPRVAKAYAEVARTRVPEDPAQLDRSSLMLPDRLRHLADWAEGDLSAGRLSPSATAEAVDLVLDPQLPAAQALHARHPESSLARLAVLAALHDQGDDAAARDMAEPLLEHHPGDPLAVAVALPLLVAAGEDERARALYQAADARHPGDALLLHADAPESITGARDGVPAWVRDPARFDERLARVSDADVRGLVPRRHASTERAAELFVPIGWVTEDPKSLRFEDEQGARIVVLSSPRASRCQGAACANDLAQGLVGQGRTQQWTRQVTLAGSEATQAVFTNAEEVLVAWVLPSGGRVLTVVMAAPSDRFEVASPVLVLLQGGLRPLDAVLPAFAAESLRAAGPTLGDGWRIAARREQARAAADSSACPVPETLAALAHDHQRAELLVDLWLATPGVAERQALLRCTSPRSAEARRIALVALLDEHPDAHAFGRRAVRTHATRVTADVRTILSTPLTPPVSAPDYLVRSDLPPHGLVEVLGALPRSHAAPLLEQLLASRDARDRTLAWAALQLRPALATDAAIDQALAGEPRLVTHAAFFLAERGGTADAQRLRDVLDALPPVSTRAEHKVLGDLAVALAMFLDPADGARLRDATTKVRDGDEREHADFLREVLRETAKDHARAIALADPTQTPGPDDGRALRWRDERRRRTLPYRPESDLRSKSLAEVLPGHDWTFARLAAPGLFSSTVADVAERLTTGDEAVDQRLGELTSRMLREGGFAALSQSGGLDVTKPIECAKPAGDVGWLCTAHVIDRAALLAVLGQRASGDDAGVSLPLTVATTAGIVPVALSLLPAILHPLLYPEDDEDDEAPDVEDAAERSRLSLEVGGMRLELYSIVDVRTRRIGIDSERYLFLGDRLWVFSTDAAMDEAMRAHEGPVLADDPEFRRLTATWKDGSALQAVALGRAWPLAEGGASMEVVLDEGGLRFRYAGAFESEAGVTDIGPAVAQLPAGAVTVFAHGLGSAESVAKDPLVAKGPDAPRVPPLPVLARARGLAFGWYLRDGDRLWRRWLAVAPLDDALRKALRRAKTPPGRPGASRRHGALCYVERKGADGPASSYLLVGDCELVDEAAAGPPVPAASREQLRVAHAVFDGPAAAARLPELDGLDLEQRALLRATAPLLGIVTDMHVEADWIPGQRVAVLEGEVGLRLRPPGDRTRVIDDWLAASEGHNAATLPRRVRSEELEAPLRYVLEVPDADAFVRHTLVDSPRVTAEVLGPTRVRMTVAPVPAKPRPDPLDAERLEDLTKTTEGLRSDDPRMVELARRLAPAGTKPTAAAERISAWVHQHITYEVTPRSLDGVEILEAGRGDCTEYARLTVALLRAADVPAEVRDGMAAAGDELVAHAWVAYHDGESWHEIDPTWGRPTASAGHLEMSVLDAIALVSLGKLKVVEIATP